MTVSMKVSPPKNVPSGTRSGGYRQRWFAAATGVLLGAGLLMVLPGVAVAADGPIQTTVPFADLRVGVSSLAVDGDGNIYAADYNRDTVTRLPADATDASQQVTLPFAGLDGPTDIAVDRFGDVFVVSYNNGRVLELPAGATSSSQTLTMPFAFPAGVVPFNLGVDSQGWVYVSSRGSNQVFKLPRNAFDSGYQTIITIAGLSSVTSLAVDAGGDLYVLAGNAAVFMPAGAAGPDDTTTVPFADLAGADTIDVDSAGDVFVVDTDRGDVFALRGDWATSPAMQVTLPFSHLVDPFGLAVDAQGDVYIIDAYAYTVQKLTRYASSTTTITQVSPPTPILGTTYWVYVSVTPGPLLLAPVGSVTISDGAGHQCGTAALIDGAAACELAASSAGTLTLTATFDGAGGFAASSTTQDIIVDAAPTFTTADPPLAETLGHIYDYTFVAAGTPAVSYSLAGDTPDWLSIQASGRVTGDIPSATTSFTYSVVASNSVGTATAGPFTVTVNVAPTFTAVDPPLTAVAGHGYAYGFAADGDPAPSYALDADAPAWLAIDSATGDVSGDVPAGLTSFTYSVVASNTDGSATAGPFTITVDTLPTFTTADPPLTVNAGQSYAYTFAATGVPNPTFALAVGAPSWLTINAATGHLSGDVPSGITSFTYTVDALNSAGGVSAGPFTVAVSPAADLSAKVVCPHRLTAGHHARCTLTVTNAGPSQATKTIGTLRLPARLTGSHCRPRCGWHHGTATWRLGKIAAHTTTVQKVTITAARRLGRAVVRGAVASTTVDPRSNNNQTTSVVRVVSRR